MPTVEFDLANMLTKIMESQARIENEIRQNHSETKTDIVRLEGKIDKNHSELEAKIDKVEAKLEAKMSNLDVKIDLVQTFTTKVPDLAEKVGELKNWRQIAIVITTAVITWFIHDLWVDKV